MLLPKDIPSMLPVPLSLHNGLLGLSAIWVFSPPGILALVRLPSLLQVCQPGSSILTPARASRVSCEILDGLTRMQVGPARRLLHWFSSWSEKVPQIAFEVYWAGSWISSIWCWVALYRLLRHQLLCDASQRFFSFALEPYAAVPSLPGSHSVTWM